MNSNRTGTIGGRLKEALSDRPNVLAILNNGSTVAGTDQAGSDVDFTVIVRQAADRAPTLGLLRRRFPYRYRGLDHGVPSFQDRRSIGVVIVDRSTVEAWMRRLYRTPREFRELQGVVQHKIVEARAIYDPGGLLSRYQTKARTYPRRIQRAIFSQAMESLNTAWKEWGSRNEFHYLAELPALLENICLALYARNRRLLMLPFKRLHVDLSGLTPDIEADLYRLVRGGRSARSRREGRKVLQRILRTLGAANEYRDATAAARDSLPRPPRGSRSPW